MKTPKSKFLVRWFVSSLGLWMASELLGSQSVNYGGEFSAVVLSGLALAIANTFIRPLVVFLTLPAVLLSLGIFMIVINALMVLLVARFTPLDVDGFGVAVITGIVIGLVNWFVGMLLEEKKK